MPRNGSGTYALPSGNPVTTATTISSTVQNNTSSDIATALTASLAKDGQTVPTANLPMGGYKHTGAAAGSARTDYATISNIQDGTGFYVATVGGTVDVITLTNSPALTSYSAGQMFSFISAGANTTNVTVNISALGAKAITKNGATALVAGDIPASALVSIMYDGTQFQLQTSSNLNPLSSITGLGTGVATALAVSLANGGGFAPTGTLLDFAGTAAPTGFLGCDGAAVSRATYASLFTAIGTTWGVGDGVTTFNLPNFQRRVAVGSGGSGTATLANTVGSTGGAETHTLTETEMPAHTHGDTIGAGGAATMPAGAVFDNFVSNTASTGGGGAHNNMQPSAVVLKIIKT
jgi:microcystin-dependent protein